MNTSSTKYIFIFIVTLLFAVTLNFSIPHNNKVSISFSELDYDFGMVDQGIEISHTFIFKNNGSDKLIIYSVNAGCGCTGVMMGEKKEYLPNEEGEIKVTFNTQGRSGFQKKNIYVYTNDHNNNQTVLSFTCEIIPNK